MAEYRRDLRKRVLLLLDVYEEQGLEQLEAFSPDMRVRIEERDREDGKAVHIEVDVIDDTADVIGYDGPADWLRRDE